MAKMLVTKYLSTSADADFDEMPEIFSELLTECNAYTDYILTLLDPPGDTISDSNNWVMYRERIVSVRSKNDVDPTYWIKVTKEVDSSNYWYIRTYISLDYGSTEEPSWYQFGQIQKYGLSSYHYHNRFHAVVTSNGDVIVYGTHCVISGSNVSNARTIPIFAITNFTKVETNTTTTKPGIILWGINDTSHSAHNASSISNLVGYSEYGNNGYPMYGPAKIILPETDITAIKDLTIFDSNNATGVYWSHGSNQYVWNVKKPVYTASNDLTEGLTILSLIYTIDQPYIASTARLVEFSKQRYTDGVYQFANHKYYHTYGVAFLNE